jgi:endoglycosylceramidase
MGAVVAAAALACVVPSVVTASALPPPATPVGHVGTWMTDAQGRVVILHGLNQVSKVAPYEPSTDGFGDDDAAFLAANGFNVMRVGVIWAAVEPTPGHYDDAYLASIKQTVATLAAHGIVSILDFHQDLYNEKFQGEGAPAWAVIDGGLPNPALGFPFNYFANLAEDRAWDSFYANAKASDGVGLEDHYAAAWAHVASKFSTDPGVLGYELLNEPWPGTTWELCAVPVVGCPAFDKKLTAFYQKVTGAIRTQDASHLVWVEPNVLFSYFDANHLGKVNDPEIGFAFHDYCATESELGRNIACTQLDTVSFAFALQYPKKNKVPALLTEFGATNDVTDLSGVETLADKNMIGWTEWAYTGNDITSSSSSGQTLVTDPSQPPTGANVNTAKLKTLAEVYPQVVAGTPKSYGFANGVFTLKYTTAKVSGGLFPTGSETDIAVPAIQYPGGYKVTVSGGHVVSAPNATTLQVVSNGAIATITVTVSAA